MNFSMKKLKTILMIVLFSNLNALSIEDLKFSASLKTGITDYSGTVTTDGESNGINQISGTFVGFTDDSVDGIHNTFNLKGEWQTGFLPHFNISYSNFDNEKTITEKKSTFDSDNKELSVDFTSTEKFEVEELNTDLYYHIFANNNFAFNMGTTLKNVTFLSDIKEIKRENCIHDGVVIDCSLVPSISNSNSVSKIIPMLFVSGEVKLKENIKLEADLRTISWKSSGTLPDNFILEYGADLTYIANESISVGAGFQSKEVEAKLIGSNNDNYLLESTSLYLSTEFRF